MDEKAEQLFPTQKEAQNVPLLSVDIEIGAPHAPLPASFYRVPQRINVCQPLPTEEEIANLIELRRPFNIGDYQTPYVADVLRAFRLLKGAKTYLEIGTFDRGNLAYVSSLLAEDAVIIGLDVVQEKSRDDLLRSHLRPGQTYHSVVGSSRDRATVNKVQEILAGRQLDSIFIDGDHTAYGVMSDYASYEHLVDVSGVILFHDSVWEGDGLYKGSADALAEIDRLDPVYLVDGENPVRRFLRPMFKNPLWGVVGVIFTSDQKWRQS